MDAKALLEQLKQERVKLDNLIEGLQARLGGSQTHAKAPGSPRRHGRTWTPAMRRAMSLRLKKVIAAKKRAARKPKAKATAKPAPKAQA